MDRQITTRPSISHDARRQALVVFRLNRATISWLRPAHRGRLWRGTRGGAL
jgi:hypothetical protein